MSGEPLRETAPAPGRGRRALAGLRYVPLGLLAVCVLVAALVGRHELANESDAVGSEASAGKQTSSLPDRCSEAVDQRLTGEPWRDRALRPASRKAFDAALAREHRSYVVGRDNWLFFTDGQASDFSQALGRERLRSHQIKAWSTYLTTMKAAAEARGGQFYIMIAPAKWDVYPEKLPRWADGLRGTNSLDLLMREHPELPFIDVRHALREADQPTYSALDSHWTDYGGYVAWKAAAACLRAAEPDNSAIRAPKISAVDLAAESNEFAADGVATPAKPARTEPVYAAAHPQTSVRSIATGDPVAVPANGVVDMTLLPVETLTPHAQTGKTLLALRDSTGSALSPLWSTTFKRTFQYQHGVGGTGKALDIAQLVDEHRPDITIFTMTERYLVFGPPTTSAKP